jgi:hypothetical protein
MVGINGASMIREIKFKKNIPVSKIRGTTWELSGAGLLFIFLIESSRMRALFTCISHHEIAITLRLWFLPQSHYREITHRNQPWRGFSHAADCIDCNGHRCNVAVRALKFHLQVRFTGDLDGVSIVSLS